MCTVRTPVDNRSTSIENMATRVSPLRSVFPLDGSLHAPSSRTPVRCILRPHFANTVIQVHSHPWAQMMFARHGVIRVHTASITLTVPPWRALWIPAGISHQATVLEDALLHALFVDKSMSLPGRQLFPDWEHCRVIEVRPLLRELVDGLAACNAAPDDVRYEHMAALTLMEVARAPVLPLGVTLPTERRLRSLCESFLAKPGADVSLSRLACEAGASVSTVNRLFHADMGCSFSEWKKQALLAEALTLNAKGFSISRIAYELGYSSISAFSFMVRQLVGLPPSKLFRTRENEHKIMTHLNP